ncbi:MAG: sulfurtransferase [Caldilinea sp.]
MQKEDVRLAAAPELLLPGRVVTTDWVAEHLEHPALRLLDVRDAAHFGFGHLPHAVQVTLESLGETVGEVPGMLLPPLAFTKAMNQLGIRPGMVVVTYDDNWGLPASRLLWALERYGFQQAALLTGGWDQWLAEGRPATAAADAPAPGTFEAHSADQTVAQWEWLQERLQDPDLVLVDTRGRQEYGAGHLPGARHWDWFGAVPSGWEAMRPADELRAELAQAGITPDKEIVTYCRSGVRAAHTYWVLRTLGYPRVRLYDGSWLEWQSIPALPIEPSRAYPH